MPTKFTYDVLRDCDYLAKDKTFRNLYRLICAHGDIKAAVWLDKDEEKSLTFSELAILCDNYAAKLSSIFGTKGRICISLDSCKEWFPLFWGLIRSGHDVLTLDASMPDEKVESLMSDTNSIGIVSAKAHHIDPKFKQVDITELIDAPAVENYVPVWGHNITLCTSGTTADSKIFVYDEKSICYSALLTAKLHVENKQILDNKNYRTLAFLPFHHILGFAAIFVWCHFLGFTMVYLKDRSPLTISRTVKTCKVNLMIAVPLLANSIAKTLKAELNKQGIVSRIAFAAMLGLSLSVQRIAPKSGLRFAGSMFKGVQEKVFGPQVSCIILGGSHTDAESLRLLNGIGYYTITGYGMTELSITSVEHGMSLENRLLGSIGTPMDYTEYRLKPIENSNIGLGKEGIVGELQVRGRCMHDARIVGGELLPPDTDEDGWFSTGDIVRYVKEKGQYFVEGRIKEIIINESGENVYPDELEEAFMNVEGMPQYTVLGLKKKHSHYEDIALVIGMGDKIGDEDLVQSLARQIRAVNKSLPVFKRLSRAIITGDPLPLANGFKIKRVTLKRMIEDREINVRNLDLSSSNKDEAVVSPSISDKAQAMPSVDRRTEELYKMVSTVYSQVLNIPEDKIDPNANFIDDLGGDSLQVLSVITRAEEAFSVMIPTEEYGRCATLNGAVELLSELVYGANNTGKTTGAQQLVKRTPISDFEKTPEFQAFDARRRALLADGGHDPYFVVHDSPLLDKSTVDGKEYLDFGSYNYAGMSGRKEVNEAAKKAIDRWGTSASGSRLLAGEKPIHGELEREIAEWKNAESAVVLVGGHSTNVTVVGNFCGKNDLILYDALAHNSIEQGCKLSDAVSKPFPHNDLASLEQILKLQRQYFEKVLIIIEGAYSMDGDVADVPGFVALKKKYACFLMVDEAHSSCVLGAHGGGVDEHFCLEQNDIDIKYGTLSKGLGTCGGYIAGRKCLIDYFRYNLPGFVFSVGISPGLAAASLEAIRLLRKDTKIMESLHSNIDYFVQEAKKRHLDICLAGESAILPVLVGADENAVALSNELNNRGILVPPALYPAVPKNKARLRFGVISEHKKEQIVYALDSLLAAAKDLGIELPRKD